MRPISPKFRKKISEDIYFSKCARKNEECNGRITIEHAWIYAGRQIDEMWNFVPLCWRHHLVDKLDKHENQRISLLRATNEDLAKYPKKDWDYEKRCLGI